MNFLIVESAWLNVWHTEDIKFSSWWNFPPLVADACAASAGQVLMELLTLRERKSSKYDVM